MTHIFHALLPSPRALDSSKCIQVIHAIDVGHAALRNLFDLADVPREGKCNVSPAIFSGTQLKRGLYPEPLLGNRHRGEVADPETMFAYSAPDALRPQTK